MKIASFNIQNLFHRDNTLVQPTMGNNLKSWVEEFHRLMARDPRGTEELDRLRELAFLMGFSNTTTEPYLVLRRKGGQLYVKPQWVVVEKKATAKVGWNGWVALRSSPIDELALKHKIQTVADADADILVLQEVEDRSSLIDFNLLLKKKFKFSYEQLLFLEGNDVHGRGMAILTRNGHTVDSVQSHTHIKYGRAKTLFDMDCQVYTITTPKIEKLVLINAHFVSQSESDDIHRLRKRQAQFVADLYRSHLKKGDEFVLVCGTLNDPAYADVLSPLLQNTQLKDLSKYDGFEVDLDQGTDGVYFRMGAYRKGVNIKQLDYFLCSPVLFAHLDASGLHRKGIWSEKKPRWSMYSTLNSKEHQASAHPLLWATFNCL